MDKIELIDRADVIADLKKQFAAVYKDTMLRPIMDDDPFIEVLAKSEGRHMQLFLDGLEEYLMTRPTIDAEWELFQRITDTYYDKQMFFLQDDGSVYDRMEAVYHSSTDAAIDAFIRRISEGEDDGKID